MATDPAPPRGSPAPPTGSPAPPSGSPAPPSGSPRAGRPRPAARPPDVPPGRVWHLARTVLTAVNGTTGVGIVLALASGAKIRRGRHGVLIAEGYRRRVPPATCFTVGSVIITRRTADWLLAAERTSLLDHESRHVGQYAALGPLFWPAYWVSCGYSYALTGSYGSRNAFERHAGLHTGGYRDLPLRPWVSRLAGRRRGRTTGEPER